jgi:hypothetical protein
MTQKIWRGDAPAIAQVTRVVPSDVEIGDSFSITCNGKSITITATEATVANVVALLIAAIRASRIAEFGEFTASAEGNPATALLLTANEAGMPFVVTASASNGTSTGVTVTTITEGAAPSGAVNAVVKFTIPANGAGNAGTFKVYHLGNASSAIAVGANAATVQTALEAISSVGAGNITVVRSTTSQDGIQLDGETDTYTCTFAGALAGSAQALVCSLSAVRPVTKRLQRGTASQNQILQIDFAASGTTFLAAGSSAFTYTLDGPFTTKPASGSFTMANAVSVVDSSINEAFGGLRNLNPSYSGNKLVVEFFGAFAGFDSGLIIANSVAGLAGTFLIPVTIVTAGHGATAGINEVQRVTLSSVPTGGTFTLTFEAQTTTAIAYNASAATVSTALQALATIGAGNCSVTGSAGGPWDVTFIGAEAAQNQVSMTGDGVGLTGGSVQGFAIGTLVASSGPNHWDEAKNWIPAGLPANGDDVVFEDTGADCLYGLLQSAVTLASLTISMAWQNRKLGLPHISRSGYREYREQQLTIGCSVVLIGTQNGTGPSRVYLDTGTVATAITIRNTGSSSDALPAFVWIGDNAANTIVMDEGEFGTSPFADVASRFSSLIMYGGRCTLKNATIVDELEANGNSVRAFDCLLGGQPLNL